MSGRVGFARRLREALARRGEVLGMNGRNLGFVYPENPRRHHPLADDKILAKDRLVAAGVPVPETLAICSGLFEIPRVLTVLSGRSDFVVKPARGSGGRGILVVYGALGPESWALSGGRSLSAVELRRHLSQAVLGAFSEELEDRPLVEVRLEPHPVLRALSPAGAADIRVIVLRGRPVLAMVRMPTSKSGGRANLHSGGIGVAVDLVRGHTVRAVAGGKVVERHPDTGERIVGVPLPSWHEVLDVAIRAARAFPLGYLGVDLVIDHEARPMVLEVNVRPGLEIQNIHGRGMMPALREAS